MENALDTEPGPWPGFYLRSISLDLRSLTIHGLVLETCKDYGSGYIGSEEYEKEVHFLC